MGGTSDALSGPDLAAGIKATDVPDGGKLLGHARGESVLLVRHGSDIHAVGATCPHYGAPLVDGVVTGETVRCPWHHACFSLKDGTATAPSPSALPCYEVQQRDGLVTVGGRLPPRQAQRPVSTPESVVIIGGGAAGDAAAMTLRERGYQGPVTIVTADDTGPVDRPNLSKDYLAGKAPEEWTQLRPASVYDEKRVGLLVRSRVTSIDRANKRVLLEDGRALSYGALLIATGAEPTRLAIPGAGLPHVLVLRSLSDSRAIIERAKTARTVVVVGAGFIGLEAAASLRARGLDVHVVAPDARPLERVMGPELGGFIHGLHVDNGVRFHLGRRPASIDSTSVTLDNGERVPADLVVMGVGVRPAPKLAESAGIAVDNGIIVDEFLQTSAPDVYAAGDVARFPDARSGASIRVEHWVVAGRQGQVAARNMLGARERFAAVPFFWSAHYDVTIAYVGHATLWDRIDIRGSLKDRDAAVAFIKGQRTLAVATVGRDALSLRIEAAMERGDESEIAHLLDGR